MGGHWKLITTQESPQKVMEQACFTVKPSVKAQEMPQVIKVKDKPGPAFKFSKIRILRSKERNLK